MENNLVFILAEGDHDTAFLYRILKANNFSSYNKKIKDYPVPLNTFLETDILNISIPEVKIQQARSRFLPSYVMKNDENLIFLYSIGGDSKKDIRISLIQALNSVNEPDEDALQTFPGASISVLFFFDADNEGTEDRMIQFKEECREAFENEELTGVYEAGELYNIDDMSVGAYVFRLEEDDSGMLEDVLLPLMRKENNDIFEAAENFLSIHDKCALFKDRLTYYDDAKSQIKKVNNIKFSYRKSLIGTVGQLQKSGMSNTVCISQTDYLTNEKILADKVCKKIFEMIEKATVKNK